MNVGWGLFETAGGRDWIAVVGGAVGLAAIAADALTSPAPCASAGNEPTGVAVAFCASLTCVERQRRIGGELQRRHGGRVRSRRRGAEEAAGRAAAAEERVAAAVGGGDVGLVEDLRAGQRERPAVEPFTGAKRWTTGPRDENDSIVALLLKGTAPTVWAVAVPLWP